MRTDLRTLAPSRPPPFLCRRNRTVMIRGITSVFRVPSYWLLEIFRAPPFISIVQMGKLRPGELKMFVWLILGQNPGPLTMF